MEDHARFVLDDAELTGALKAARHELAEAAASFDPSWLLGARDTAGDVGTQITAESERRRGSAEDIARAAAKRVCEALRVLEEHAKLCAPEAAGRFEALRYRVYRFEQRLVLSLGRAERLRKIRLYVLITEAVCQRPWMEAAEAAIRGGADCLQLREKHLSDRELLRRARLLVGLCRERGVLCVVNDRPDIARLAGADGVHLGQDDLPVSEARWIVGPRGLIGKSTHSLEQVRAALGEGPDYIAVGPMYPSHTKPQEHVAGPETLAAVVRMVSRPSAAPRCGAQSAMSEQTPFGPIPGGRILVAIGGITADNVEAVMRAGAWAVAVCSAVVAQPDPEAAARRLKEALLTAASSLG